MVIKAKNENIDVKAPLNSPKPLEKVTYTPPSLGKSLYEIFSITGKNANFEELAKPKNDKRVFKDDKGVFMEQKKSQKGEKIISE